MNAHIAGSFAISVEKIASGSGQWSALYVLVQRRSKKQGSELEGEVSDRW